MAFAWLCDFDGTIAPDDIGAAWIERYAPPAAAPARRLLLERWMRGEIGSRELTRAELEGLRCRAAEALAFTRRHAIDPGFAPFVREARAGGEEVMVVSDGFDFSVRDHLERAGLGDVPWAANHVDFAPDGAVAVSFPHAGGCGRCGNCKAQHVARWRAAGFATVMVGDGLSDRCGALAADHVLARGGLLAWCRREGVPAAGFADFAAVAALAREWRAAERPRRARA